MGIFQPELTDVEAISEKCRRFEENRLLRALLAENGIAAAAMVTPSSTSSGMKCLR
jgi:hypothetical protein